MLKSRSILAASAAAILFATAPAFAGQTMTLNRTMVADLGHETDAMARLGSTDAKLLSVAPAEIPNAEQFYFSSGTAAIAVRLNASGAVTQASVVKTTGFSRVDASALKAVRGATYQAATIDGKPVGGEYIVKIEFTADR